MNDHLCRGFMTFTLRVEYEFQIGTNNLCHQTIETVGKLSLERRPGLTRVTDQQVRSANFRPHL
jgi:hypothetical protein